MIDAETLKKMKAEAEKESRLKAERAGCGTPAWLVEVMRPNMEIEQYLGKRKAIDFGFKIAVGHLSVIVRS